MKATYIDYSETQSFSPAVLGYLDGKPEYDSFISYRPNLEGFTALLKNKNVIADRQVLLKVLKEQYREIELQENSLVGRNIESLSGESTYTITTGHQLNLFTGPLYFIFKIVTAINLASELKANFPEKDFVPVYWMATEDHDFDEINHTYIGGKKVSWTNAASGATGRLNMNNIGEAIKEYTGVLGLTENAMELSNLIETAYSQNTLAGATRYLVHELFEEYGLVVLDADCKEFKSQFAGIIFDDITGGNSFHNISKSIIALQNAGIDAPVNPREINFFYLTEGLRERIVLQNERYTVLNSEISFSQNELKTEIQNFPERFSPNVVMRPLYQEVILPNIAYIGGGAEVVYWLELKKNFDHYQVDFPILILRNSALIDGNKLKNVLQLLKLKPGDLFKTADALKKQWVTAHSEHTLNLQDEWREMQCIFEKLKLRAQKIDPTLSASADAVKARLSRAIIRLEKKMVKAEKRNYADSLQRIDNFKRQLFPKGGLQERSENFGLFYVAHGKSFISSLISNFKPLDFKFSILQAE